jgi:hypothetical protein
MRRLLSSLAAISLLTAQAAQAQLECLSPTERSAVQVAALRSQLMVLATGCQDDSSYNAFIRKYQADLMSNERMLAEIFKHKYGRRGQRCRVQPTCRPTRPARTWFRRRRKCARRSRRPRPHAARLRRPSVIDRR